ncbi:HNH endonuclease signature motif containing protein [Floricoccus penangensis]|uniref:HNH endonuclease signature motif containing protein n=1 Tax=Floricoccus penangensis TaxID=1859475 RepID=UPI00204152F5|nr:HNH endonuclease signature motif containing protein [Floricoccus penangensis]URZ87132.1 HNH endonuclease [Floricoccus penangensis]
MKKVNNEYIPTVIDVVDRLPSSIDDDNKNKLKQYLKIVEDEYREKSVGLLCDIKIPHSDLLETFEKEKFASWYEKNIRPEKKGLFQKFPVEKNVNQNAICPICEGVFSTKVTLEHIIPKADGEGCLAILPVNLIKCCGECNTSKHSKKSSNQYDSEINLYFESFDISDKIYVKFENDSEVFLPKLSFKYGDCSKEKRIKNFINIYNIEKTYNHRIRLEYHRIQTVLSNIFPTNILGRSSIKFILLSFMENEKNSYEENCKREKINNQYWIDQNYFGYLICKSLIKYLNDDEKNVDRLVREIKYSQNSCDNLVFENEEFLEKWKLVSDENELESFMKKNINDVREYYSYLKKNNLPFQFPELFKPDNKENNDFNKSLIQEICKYYIENEKDFNDFGQKYRSLIE